MDLVERFRNEGTAFRIFAVFGFIAPLITFLIALSELSAVVKIILLAITAVAYLGLFILFSRGRAPMIGESEFDEIGPLTGTGSFQHDRFAALDEANQFFGVALKQGELFRLVAARINEIFPFEAAAFFVPNSERGTLDVVETVGDNSEELFESSLNVEDGLAVMAFVSGEVEMDPVTSSDEKRSFSIKWDSYASTSAIPLVYEGRVLGVLQLFCSGVVDDPDSARETLRGLQTRITPLFLGSYALERSVTGTFTDELTDLPNVRALFMVLENQLAESARFRGDRPLTVLSIDIKNFHSINERFGHSTGDKILIEVAEGIRGQLRKMDFLARTEGDEFLVVLPLAGEHATADVISRIVRKISLSNIQIDELEIQVGLNFGAATYWEDGETPHQLVQNAQLHKQKAKAEESGNVVSFPKEYVN